MSWVGRQMVQREDRKLVQGRGTYVDDIHLKGMVHVAIVRSPYGHAEVTGIDAAPAIEGGALAVYTGADLVGATEPFELRFVGCERPLKYHALATDKVRFVGDPVVAVVAEDRYRAEALADEVFVDYEDLDAVASPDAALAEGAPLLYSEWGSNILHTHRFQHGNMEKAIREADLVVEETISSQRHTAHPMETRGIVAEYDGEVLTVWTSHQMPHLYRTVIAEHLKFPENRIRVIAPNVGGGFGVKYNFYNEDVLVPFIAMKLGRPVKWIEDRREHFVATAHAREQELTVTLAVSQNGTILGLRARSKFDLGSGAILFTGLGPMFAGAASMPMGYRFQVYDYEGVAVVTNKTPHGAYRGFGCTEVCLAFERALDIAAARLGIDPVEIRRRNLLTEADLPYRGASGAYYQSGSFQLSLEKALDAVEYERFRERQAAAMKEGRLLGIGMATYVEGVGATQFGVTRQFGNWEYCRVTPSPDGKVTVYSGIASQGQSHETMLSQVVADELGLHPDEIHVILADTDKVPYGYGAFASRGAMLGGAAAVRACDDLKQKLTELASHLAETGLENLEYRDGKVQVKGQSERSWSFAELARLSYMDAAHQPGRGLPLLQGEGRFDMSAIDRPADPDGRIPRYASWSDGACVVTCEVDPETGFVKLEQIIMAHDCGKVINPVAVDGQLLGGLAQAVGGSLLEELAYSEDGQLLTGSFMDYLLPTASDMPPVKLLHLETMAKEIPGGFKGMGESSTIVGPAAIANAVADALRPLGVEVTAMPLSPDRVWRLIQSATPKGERSNAS